MLTVGFVGYKGGSGKSTTTANFGVVAALHGYRVALVDLDEQGSLATWASLRQVGWPEVLAMPARDLHAFIRRSSYDLCLIDTPGHDWSHFKIAASLADLSIIVARPTTPDIAVAILARDFLQRWRGNWAFLVNQAPPRSATRLFEWIDAYRGMGTIVDPPLPALMAFQDAWSAGLGVSEFAPGARGDIEMRQTARWILRRLGVRS